MKNAKLNEKEIQVLMALYRETLACTGGEFGFVEDSDRCRMKNNEFAGYVSQLKQKGLFDYHYAQGEFAGQFALTEEAIKIASESK